MASPSSYPAPVGYNEAVSDAASETHRRWSVECFNRAWSLIELPRRTADEDSEMLQLAMASLWHWRQRPECGPRERSIGCWQVSRCAALAGHASLAVHFAERALHESRQLAPFYRGYAHEGMARASALCGDSASMGEHLAQARRLAATVEDDDDRSRLESDLDSLAATSIP